MFAYCNNNPTRFTDPLGSFSYDPNYYPNQQLIKYLTEWFIESDENETDSNGELTFNARLKRTVSSVFYNFEFSAGVGVGIGQELKIIGIGETLVCHYDPIAIQYSDGTWMFGDRLEVSLSASATQAFEFGGGIDCFRQNQVPIDPSAWIIYNNTKETWTLSEFSYYDYFVGGNLAIGFDLNTFLSDMNEIWR